MSGVSAESLSGRIEAGPDRLLHEEILEPQFRYEVAHLLPWYVEAEKVLVLEYLRMGLVTAGEAACLRNALDDVTAEKLTADRSANMSDIVFAIEKHVLGALTEPIPAWHLDRSRNDLQACAQLLFGRAELAGTAESLTRCVRAAHALALRNLDLVMPGYTHLQPAQITTPGHYLAALSEHLIHSSRRLLDTYDDIDTCPLGAGAMTGPHLPWDRERIAELLGFARAWSHPLVAVASRTWVLQVAAECSTFGVVLGRFVTDLMAWTSDAYGFADLPDELAGISSAMPHKRNFPVLERVRARAAHLTGWYVDAALCQRATPFANSVEVSKEGGAHVADIFGTTRSVLSLMTAALGRMTFSESRMRAVCEDRYLGGTLLANRLTLVADVPSRAAQVISGSYIASAVKTGRPPGEPDPDLLVDMAARRGYPLRQSQAAAVLGDALSPSLEHRRGHVGSPHPQAVRRIIEEQSAAMDRLEEQWRQRRTTVRGARHAVDDLFQAETGQGGH
ncbi:argininosuccinate lyase [Nonomuraea sp. MTCD27]|uniref:argininosuccinate lyase n=1 Tax=Nonomuraea sp. MTCD27 TaxID=1676747 RepID=UPI0035C07101